MQFAFYFKSVYLCNTLIYCIYFWSERLLEKSISEGLLLLNIGNDKNNSKDITCLAKIITGWS